jgi:hypothetical protein
MRQLSAPQVTSPEQLELPEQRTWLIDAPALTLLQACAPEQVRSQVAPPQTTGPAHEPSPEQPIEQLVAPPQSIPLAQALCPQVTWQARPSGQTIGAAQAPSALQSNAHRPATSQAPPALAQTAHGSGAASAASFASLAARASTGGGGGGGGGTSADAPSRPAAGASAAAPPASGPAPSVELLPASLPIIAPSDAASSPPSPPSLPSMADGRSVCWPASAMITGGPGDKPPVSSRQPELPA